MADFDWMKALKGIGAIQNIARYKSPRQQQAEAEAQALAARLKADPMLWTQYMQNPSAVQERARQIVMETKQPGTMEGVQNYRNQALGGYAGMPSQKKKPRPIRDFLQDSVLSNIGPWADLFGLFGGSGGS
mgnify:CR=1 FL=1